MSGENWLSDHGSFRNSHLWNLIREHPKLGSLLLLKKLLVTTLEEEVLHEEVVGIYPRRLLGPKYYCRQERGILAGLEKWARKTRLGLILNFVNFGR